MAIVKIYLEDDETEIDASEVLRKALESHNEGNGHKETFHQPAAQDVVNTMISEHAKMWERILRKVNKLVDEEVNDNI